MGGADKVPSCDRSAETEGGAVCKLLAVALCRTLGEGEALCVFVLDAEVLCDGDPLCAIVLDAKVLLDGGALSVCVPEADHVVHIEAEAVVEPVRVGLRDTMGDSVSVGVLQAVARGEAETAAVADARAL